MKENKYDEEIFFEKYSQMSRSREGLSGAGEWESLRGLMPDFKGKRVLDLGCGYGWHCIYAMEQGAESAVGVDLSEKMLQMASEKTEFPQVEYIRASIEDVELEDDCFDIVISSLAFHYVACFEDVVKKVRRTLKKDGIFLFSAEHPVFTAYGTQDWYYGSEGEKLHFPVDRYFCEGERQAVFLGEPVVKYHRTLTTYLNGLLDHGFELLNVTEPQPSEEMLKTVEGMADELRRPMMLIVKSRKKA